jgi:flagellar biosynthesis protein FlhG
VEPHPDLRRELGPRPPARWWQRFAAPAPPPRAEASVIAVASGKGGTGKSFLATNVAVALHRRGLRVVLVDCDFGLANAHLLFGVNPRLSIHHLFAGGIEVSEVVTPTAFGPNLIAGGSGISSLAELGERHLAVLATALGWLAARYDAVLLDCAAGLSPQALLTTMVAEHVLLVTNPEIAALTDAYALVKCLARQSPMPGVHLVVNRVSLPDQGRQTFARLAEVSRRFTGCSIHYSGDVPEDAAVTHRRLGQPPLIVSDPQCPTAMAVNAVLSTLEARIGALGRHVPADQGVAHRLERHLRRGN